MHVTSASAAEAVPAWAAAVADALAEARVAVVRDAFAPSLVTALRSCALQRDAEGTMRPAGVGRANACTTAPAIRGDRIAWLDENAATPEERAHLDAMHALARALNRDLMLGLASLEAHYAIYPPGAGYARHRDRFRDDDARVLSCIAYLNDGWRPADGGALRIHYSARPSLDIFPEGGTLVAFASDRFEHEVLPATRTRIALTGWFRRRTP